MPTKEKSEPSGNRPVHEIRYRSIRAAIWRNETNGGNMYAVTVSRSYRDGDTWKDSHSFAFDELMNLAKALYDAHSHVAVLMARDNAAARERLPIAPRPPRRGEKTPAQ
jgi:hypothetical protein